MLRVPLNKRPDEGLRVAFTLQNSLRPQALQLHKFTFCFALGEDFWSFSRILYLCNSQTCREKRGDSSPPTPVFYYSLSSIHRD